MLYTTGYSAKLVVLTSLIFGKKTRYKITFFSSIPILLFLSCIPFLVYTTVSYYLLYIFIIFTNNKYKQMNTIYINIKIKNSNLVGEVFTNKTSSRHCLLWNNTHLTIPGGVTYPTTGKRNVSNCWEAERIHSREGYRIKLLGSGTYLFPGGVTYLQTTPGKGNVSDTISWELQPNQSHSWEG